MRLHKQAMKPRLSVLAAVCALTAIPAVAKAQEQPWLRDRAYTEGIGYRAGDFEIHPGLAAEFGYDSNYLHREDPAGSLRLRITPSLSLSTLGKQRREPGGGPPPDIEFRAGFSATYNEFFPVTSGQETAIREQRNIAGKLDLNLSILPSRPWSVNLNGTLAHIPRPSPSGVKGALDGGTEANTFNQYLARLGGELIWTPGSGLFDWRLGYQFTATVLPDYGSNTNFDHQIQTRGRWRFLPRTALMYDARFDFINYPNALPGGKTDSHPVRAQIGVNGLVTSSFALMALAGWGASFYSPTPQDDFNSVIGQVELKWFITPNPSTDPAGAGLALSTLSVGFIRDFQDSEIGTYVERDRGYATLSYFFGGRFLVLVDGGVGPMVYPRIPGLKVVNPFTDIRVDASLFGEYRIKSAYGINATLRYGQNVSNTSVENPDGTGTQDELRWQEFEVYLGARWLM